MRTEEPRTIRLEDYRPPAYRITDVSLEFDLDPSKTRIRATMSVVDNGQGGGPFKLDGDNLPLLSIALDGQPLDDDAYSHDDNGLTLHEVPDTFTLVTETEIAPDANTALEGLYVSSGMFCTQCEAEGFRRITFFQDRPDVLATYRVTMTADKTQYPVLLSNGNPVSSEDFDDGHHRAVWHDPFPKPSYLFALVAGDLGCLEDSFTTASGREVALRIWSEHGNEPRCTYAMDSLKRSMRWDEERFGLEYDLDIFNIVAVGDFNMGAMENKSLNIFNSKLVLASPETATDADYAFIESVIAHEYFHNWTGNRVTCRDWFQLSLKEGLTVFRDQEFSSDMRSRPVKRIEDVRALRAAQFPEDASPLAHPIRPASYIEINNFYTPTVYEKGAEVIRMIERIVGRDGFRRGLDLYFERHDGEAATCDDFVAAMADANDVDFTHFKLWYSQAGTPELSVVGHWDEAAKRYSVGISQVTPPTPGQPDKKPLFMPIDVALIGPDGAPLEMTYDGASGKSHVVHLQEAEQTFVFEGVAENPVLSINRAFSAPVRIRSDAGDTADAFLMAHDSDPFNRWESGQQYGTRLLLRGVAEIQNGRDMAIDGAFIGAIKSIIDDGALDPAFAAQAILLPGEGYLADQMEVVDVEAIHTARETLREAIAGELDGLLQDTYRACLSNVPYSPDAAEAGRRALKNTALGYLAAGGHVDMVATQYRNGDNMTDRMAALGLLSELKTPERQSALDDFHERFKDDALVVDKWYSVQARSSRDDTLDQVTALMERDDFTLRNPNRVRALVGAFAMGNPLNFHRADGAGYGFVADRIIEIDALNPQLAARLIDPLGRWRRFDSARKQLMKSALDRILGTPNLSRDVFEKASKSLDDSTS
ncbi:MAG: aminopeptidase N [Pseudomonadota bacterium]